MHFFFEIIPKDLPGLTNAMRLLSFALLTLWGLHAQGSKMPQCILYLLFPNIHMQILQNALHTFS